MAPSCQKIISCYMAFHISIGQMLFLAQTLDNVDPLCAPVITTDFYLHYIEVPDQDPARRRL